MDTVKWLPFRPPFTEDGPALKSLLLFAGAFGVVCDCKTAEERNMAAERLRRSGLQVATGCKGSEQAIHVAAIHVLTDLVKQGWRVRVVQGSVEVARRDNGIETGESLRQRVRSQLHAERDEQLRQPPVREFVQSLETRRIFGDHFPSIFSLMRDGKELAERLSALRELPGEADRLKALSSVIRPTLQFVSEGDLCKETGLRLADIWRYFRHTWANPYKSIPGRSMMVLVRDTAAPFHPVIGIAALSSAAVAQAARDAILGWTGAHVLARMAQPTAELARWLQVTVEEAIQEVYVTDLLRSGLLTVESVRHPTTETVEALEAEGKAQRKRHYRMMEAKDYKKMPLPQEMTEEDWVKQAESLLFLSKRCKELSLLLKVRMTLGKFFGTRPSKEGLRRLIETGEGREAVTRVVRKVKAERVGTAIGELTVCGAVPPYNELLGGKLVAMLMASPDVLAEYRRRYGCVPSVIASSMAGRPVVRPADLVFIGTTSLYAQRPTQYDRISIPLNLNGPPEGPVMRYQYLGRTKGVGTFHFGEKTVEALGRLLANSRRGQRVNSVFGEGTNPRLRKIRDGLDTLGLSSDELLQHGAPRLVYGVELAANVCEYLLGLEKRPRYYFPQTGAVAVTLRIAEWWTQRWLLPRVDREGILHRVVSHSLVYPITHGARVPLPENETEEHLFDR